MTDHEPSAEQAWADLVTAALLGTDRRGVPALPAGPLADALADGVFADPAERMLAAVALLTIARRSAFITPPAAALLQPPEDDPRPLIPDAAAVTWRTITAEWPVLEDEWMLAVVTGGWRLSADVLVDALGRYRSDPVRRARVGRAAGPLAGWLVGHEPGYVAAQRRPVPAAAVTTLPPLALPPELAELLAADALTFGRGLAAAASGAGPAHKPVLVNLLARCRPAVLGEAAAVLGAEPSGLAWQLADLVRLRRRALDELEPVSR